MATPLDLISSPRCQNETIATMMIAYILISLFFLSALCSMFFREDSVLEENDVLHTLVDQATPVSTNAGGPQV